MNSDTVLTNKKQMSFPSADTMDNTSQQFKTVPTKLMKLSLFHQISCVDRKNCKQNIAASTDFMYNACAVSSWKQIAVGLALKREMASQHSEQTFCLKNGMKTCTVQKSVIFNNAVLTN
jgi:hypothetical protein